MSAANTIFRGLILVLISALITGLITGLLFFINFSLISDNSVFDIFSSGDSQTVKPALNTAPQKAPAPVVIRKAEPKPEQQPAAPTSITTFIDSGESSSSRRSSHSSGSSSSSSTNQDSGSSQPENQGPENSPPPRQSTPTLLPPSQIDRDRDNYMADVDCNDNDDEIYPNAEETPYDNIDQDCSGSDLIDVDGDGYDARAAGGNDCKDLYEEINPGAAEVQYNYFDDDCNTNTRDAQNPAFPKVIRAEYPGEETGTAIRAFFGSRIFYPELYPDGTRLLIVVPSGSSGRIRLNIGGRVDGGGTDYEIVLDPSQNSQVIDGPLPLWQG